MATKEVVAPESTKIEFDLPDWDYVFEHEQDIYRLKRAYTGDKDKTKDKDNEEEDEDNDDEDVDVDVYVFDYECEIPPIVVADTNLDPPSLTTPPSPPKKRSKMSLSDQFIYEVLLPTGRGEKNKDPLFLCDGVYHGRKTVEKRLERSAQITLQKKMKMDRLSGESKNVSSESDCSH